MNLVRLKIKWLLDKIPDMRHMLTLCVRCKNISLFVSEGGEGSYYGADHRNTANSHGSDMTGNKRSEIKL